MGKPVRKTFSFEGGIFYDNKKFYHVAGILYQEWGNINGYIAFFSLHKEDQAIPTIMEIKGELSICDKGLKVLELLTSTIEKSLLVKIKKMYEYKLKELGPRGSLVFKGKIKRDSVERKGHSIEIQLKEEKI